MIFLEVIVFFAKIICFAINTCIKGASTKGACTESASISNTYAKHAYIGVAFDESVYIGSTNI